MPILVSAKAQLIDVLIHDPPSFSPTNPTNKVINEGNVDREWDPPSSTDLISLHPTVSLLSAERGLMNKKIILTNDQEGSVFTEWQPLDSLERRL